MHAAHRPSPDDDLVALRPVKIQVRFGPARSAVQPNMRRTWTEEEHRTCRPLDRGQNSTKCTSLRRALGIVGDSCQEHGGSQSCRITSSAANRCRASLRTEPTRILSLERTPSLLPRCVVVCNVTGGGRVNSVVLAVAGKEKKKRERERK